MNIAPSVIQAVKERLNLADVVRRYVPDLKMIAGRWMCICPFHAETKPSMNIHEDTGFFHCFGCQAKGDVIEFVRRIEGLDFQETIRKLAAEAGVQLGQEDPQAVELAQRKKNALAMHVEASAMFREVLAGPMGETARAYLSKRGISEATAGRFQVGVSPEDWHALHDRLAAKGWKKEAALEAGLLTRNTKGDRVFDRFRGRLMFPIHNLAGHVVAFGGRVLGDGEPKYLNTSDSPIFRKGEHLYGLAQARTSIVREKRALLTEGYVDVLSLHQFGFNNSVGVLGTALTSEQVKRLLGFCSEILLIFDGDGPGRKAAFRSSELLILAGARGKVVLLPDGEDVDSLLQRQGREALDACLSMAQDSLDFCLTVAKEEMAPREMLAWARTFMRRLMIRPCVLFTFLCWRKALASLLMISGEENLFRFPRLRLSPRTVFVGTWFLVLSPDTNFGLSQEIQARIQHLRTRSPTTRFHLALSKSLRPKSRT
jgi:DNA primase